jgi:uncharacterized protein YaiL (DUF2058 family)
MLSKQEFIMGNALRDQLLKSGLVNEKQLKQATKEKQKEVRQQHGQGGKPKADEARAQQQRQAAEKAERDRQLNLQRKEEADRKAKAAEFKQLVEAHAQPAGDGDILYNFVDGGHVKRLYVTGKVRDQLASGRLAIVRCEGRYSLVASEVARKIKERHEGGLVLWNQSDEAEPAAAEDPYARFQVPDDLMW